MTEPTRVRVLPAGDAAVLVEVAGGATADVLRLDAALRADPPDWVQDVVPAHASVLVSFDPRAVRPGQAADWVREAGRAAAEAPAPPGGTVEIRVRYDGDDLAEVGRLTGLGAEGVVAAHTGTLWTVAFTGFAPGFGYLVPEDPDDRRLDVPRRETPRTRVPAGAVALAAGYTGVYPRPSPGGWQLLGRTGERVWDETRDPPALLRPGARVRFVEAAG